MSSKNDNPNGFNPLLIGEFEPDSRPFDWPIRDKPRTQVKVEQPELFDNMDKETNGLSELQIESIRAIFNALNVLVKQGVVERVDDNGHAIFKIRENNLLFSLFAQLIPTPVSVQAQDEFFSDCEAQERNKNVLPFDPNYSKPSLAQPELLSVGPRKKKKWKLAAEPIPEAYKAMMIRLCFRVEPQAHGVLRDDQIGRATSAIRRLMDVGAELQYLPSFEDWWRTTWMSRQKHNSNGYQVPRPEQVQEHWFIAMDWLKQKAIKDTKTNIKPGPVVDIRSMMLNKASERGGNNV